MCAFHLKVVLRRLEGVGGYVGEVVGGFCVWCVAVVAATAAAAAAAAAAPSVVAAARLGVGGGSRLVLRLRSLSLSPCTCVTMFLLKSLSLCMFAPWSYSLVISVVRSGRFVTCVVGSAYAF